MAVRLDNEDAVDRQVRDETKGEGRFAVWFAGLLFIFNALVFGVSDWFSGKSLKSYGHEMGLFLAVLVPLFLAERVISPIYKEFRLRTRSIDTKVSAIQETLTSSKKDQSELLEKVIAIEERLDTMQRSLESQTRIMR